MEPSHINVSSHQQDSFKWSLTINKNFLQKPINPSHVIIFAIGFLVVMMSLGLVFCLVFQYFYAEHRDKKLREKVRRRRRRKINTMFRKNPALLSGKNISGSYDVTPLTWSIKHGLRVNTRALKTPYAYHPISIEIEEAPCQHCDEYDVLEVDEDTQASSDELDDKSDKSNDDDKSQVGDIIKPIVKFSRYSEVNRTRWNMMRTPTERKSSLRSVVQQASGLNLARIAEQARLNAANAGTQASSSNLPNGRTNLRKFDKEIMRAMDDDEQENAAQVNQNFGNTLEDQTALTHAMSDPNQERKMVREPTVADHA